jgi:hypothetical protein
MKFGTNTAIFLLFFGIAFIEAIQTQNFLLSLLFFGLGIVFLFADNVKRRAK